MMLFTSQQEFALGHAGVTKWERLLTALAAAQDIADGVAHSVGDSLTYWRQDAASVAAAKFVGHRRYQTVFSTIEGSVTVEVAPQARLSPLGPYDDLSDRRHYSPEIPEPARSWSVTPGQLLVIPIDHAWRIVAQPGAQVLTVRITVEGATFHNK